MSDAFRIALARTQADIADVARLFSAYADLLDVDLFKAQISGEIAGLPGQFAAPGGELLLGRLASGREAGCVALRWLAPGCCEMKRLYVVPEARGLRLGGALVDAIIEAARALGYREMWLDTLAWMTEAHGVYRRRGFAPIARYHDEGIPNTIFFGRAL